ncbi:MAG: flagellar motor switch protein FliN [Phycisphaerales bacterium]
MAETQPNQASTASTQAEAALAAAQAAIASLNDPEPAPPPAAVPEDEDPVAAAMAEAMAQAAPVQLENFAPASNGAGAKGIELLSDVNLNVTIELGRTRMLVEDVLKLTEGAVVELDKLAGDPVDVYVNHRHIARGEVLVLNDNFCVRIHEIIGADSNEKAAAKAKQAKG